MSAVRKRQPGAASQPRSGLVPILERSLADLRPAAANDRLYRPVSDSDPDVIELARSIRTHGLQEPIVITRDDVILSGHRRAVACGLAGLDVVTCRIENLLSTDAEFLIRLREYNRQRVKSLDEVAREAVVSADPEEGYRALIEHRIKESHLEATTMPILGVKHRARISRAKEPMLQAILGILEARKAFWPLTERQIHYALLNDPPLVHAKKAASRYANTQACYKATCDLVTRARLEGRVPFAAIADPTRPVEPWRHFQRDPGAFLRTEMDGFLKGYRRDLQQSQPNHLEIVGEKNTIQGMIRPVAASYGVPWTIGRGYCSLPPRHAMQQRFRASGKETLIILVLSDFDPEGEDIAHSFARSMRDDFGIAALRTIKVALTGPQVRQLNLPPAMKAKKSSSRYDDFVERHGDDVFELEALPPEQLQHYLREAIDSVLDVAAFNAEIAFEKRDAAQLHGIRQTLKDNFAAWIPPPDAT
jgi:ParB-like chromosome segregation protein Spo0J